MSVLKVVEIMGNSSISFEDAIKNIVDEASKTIKNIKSVYVQDMQVTVNNNKVEMYKVTSKVCFSIMND